MAISGILLAILCNFLWGTAIPFIKIGTKALELSSGIENQFFFAGLRFFLSGVMLFAYSLIKEKKIPTIKKENRLSVFFIMLLGTILQYGFMYAGLLNTKSADGNIFTSLSGFFTVMLTPFFFKDDHFTVKKIVGVLIGLSGVLLISLKGTGIYLSLNGEVLLIIGTLCFVFSSFLTKKMGNKESALNITAYNLLLGGLVLLVTGIAMGGKFGKVTVSGILCLLYLALLSALAFTIWAYLLKIYKASSLGIFNLVNPVVGTILAALVIAEELEPLKYISALLLVSLGIIIINSKEKKTQIS